MESKVKALTELFEITGETHHKVYRKENGTDADWPLWYATWLVDHSELMDHLANDITKSELIHFLVAVDQEYAAKEQEKGWHEYYAQKLIEQQS